MSRGGPRGKKEERENVDSLTSLKAASDSSPFGGLQEAGEKRPRKGWLLFPKVRVSLLSLLIGGRHFI